MVARACNSSYMGVWDTRMVQTWEAEVAASRDPATALQPGWQSETQSWNFKKRKKKLQTISITTMLSLVLLIFSNTHSPPIHHP